MTTRLIVIRHGESEANAADLYIGQTDMPLSPKGKLQAQKTADFLRDTPIDVIYASDLIRTMQTAQPIADSHHLPVIPDAALREIDGGAWEKRSFDELEALFADDYARWREDISTARCTDGESIAALAARIEVEFTRIAQAHPGKTVCVVTHATPIRTMACVWRQLPLHAMNDIRWVTNDSVTTVTFSAGRWALETLGADAHLGDIASILPPDI